MIGRAVLLAACLAAPPLWAQDLPKGAQHLGQEQAAPGQGVIATGPWTAAGGLPALRITGAVTTTSWQIPAMGMGTLPLMTRLEAGLQAEGFRPLFACAAAECGGFDFRFAIPVLAEPDMHVDLGDFRYLAVQKPGAKGDEHRALLISRGPGLLYVQITTILPPDPKPALAGTPEQPIADATPLPRDAQTAILPEALPDSRIDTRTVAAMPKGGVIAALTLQGGVALDDLVFAPGAADLAAGEYASLQDLGGWLLANPTTSVALVGHTDATGGLAGNLALSKRRADSVRRWLAERFDLAKGQVVAEGVGYLAPRASNATPEGQAKNRRVEVIVTSTR